MVMCSGRRRRRRGRRGLLGRGIGLRGWCAAAVGPTAVDHASIKRTSCQSLEKTGRQVETAIRTARTLESTSHIGQSRKSMLRVSRLTSSTIFAGLQVPW